MDEKSTIQDIKLLERDGLLTIFLKGEIKARVITD